MRRLTKVQKQELWGYGRRWITHAGHWTIALILGAFTLAILYALWGSDAIFAAALMGVY